MSVKRQVSSTSAKCQVSVTREGAAQQETRMPPPPLTSFIQSPLDRAPFSIPFPFDSTLSRAVLFLFPSGWCGVSRFASPRTRFVRSHQTILCVYPPVTFRANLILFLCCRHASGCDKSFTHANDIPQLLDKVHEDDISTVIERACDPESKDGRWITQYDIVEVSRADR